jgi:hypothetical protein
MRVNFDISLRKDALSPLWTLKIDMGDATHIFKLYNSEVKEIARNIPKEFLPDKM